MGLSEDQIRAAAGAIRNEFSNGFEWEDFAQAVRVGAEHVEGFDLSGSDKKEAAVRALRELVSDKLWKLITRWRGPLAFGFWGYPVLRVAVYPVLWRCGMWAYDQLAPRFLDLLVDASKGRLALNVRSRGPSDPAA